MQSCAPTRLLMCVAAQRPNAALPPVLFIIATSAPSSTMNARMPTLYGFAMDLTNPSEKTCVTVPSKENPE